MSHKWHSSFSLVKRHHQAIYSVKVRIFVCVKMIFQCLGVVTRNHLMPVVCGVYSVAVSTTVIINTFSVYPFGRNILISDPIRTPCLVQMPKCVSLAFMSKKHSAFVLVSKCFFYFCQQSNVTDEKNDDKSVATAFGVNRPTISCFFDSKLQMLGKFLDFI